VQRNGQNQQGAPPPLGGYPFPLCFTKIDVQVWQVFIEGKNEKTACQKTYGCGHPGHGRKHFFTHFYAWVEEAPKTGCHHYAAGKPQHTIEYTPVHGFEKQNQTGSQCGNKPGKQGSQQGGIYRANFLNKCYYFIHHPLPLNSYK
jgi:hypothetical protein